MDGVLIGVNSDIDRLNQPLKDCQDRTIRLAIEIRSGVVQNPKILSFQGRAADHPHPPL